MNVTIKLPDEQEKMRVAGRLAADVLDMIGEHVRAGVTTDELDRICHQYITETQEAVPAPLNYRGFPKIHLYFRQSCRLSRHPGRAQAQIRGRGEYRHHGHQGRLSR